MNYIKYSRDIHNEEEEDMEEGSTVKLVLFEFYPMSQDIE